MSLEVDRRNDLPIPQQPQKEPYQYQDEKQSRGYAYAVANNDSSTSTHQRFSKRSTVFLLATALAIMTILAVIAAALGGSTAVKRRNE